MKKTQKGITLVALIITIIVLLILAVVAIKEFTGTGIISYAQRAKKEYEEKKAQENEILGDYLDYIYNSQPESIADLQKKYEFKYYSTLELALNDVNVGNTNGADSNDTDAVSAIYINEDEKPVVVLMKDAVYDSDNTINITNEMILNLGGKKITLVGDNSYLFFKANATIDGRLSGSTIEKKNATSKGRMVNSIGSNLVVNGGTYIMEIAASGTAIPFIIAETAEGANENAVINNCNIVCKNTGAGRSVGIQTQSKDIRINNTNIYVYSKYIGSSIQGIMAVSGKGSVKNSKIEVETQVNSQIRGIELQPNSEVWNIEGCTINTSSSYYSDEEENVANPVYGILKANQYITTIKRSSISTCSNSSEAIGIETFYATGGMKIIDTTVYASSDNSWSNGIYILPGTTGDVDITNTKVFADASNTTDKTSVGITNAGTGIFKFYSGDVTGVHSGLQTCKDSRTYIYGGKFASCYHGGIYFAHGPDGEAYVENATLTCEEYNGKYDYSEIIAEAKNIYNAAMYMGGGTNENNSNMTTYLDNCTLGGENVLALVLRGSSGEYNNHLYISNTDFTGKKVRIDETKNASEDIKQSILHLGTGNKNYGGPNNDISALYIEDTNVSYKR